MKKYDGAVLFLNKGMYPVKVELGTYTGDNKSKTEIFGEFSHRQTHGIIILAKKKAIHHTFIHEFLHACFQAHGYSDYCLGGFTEEYICDKVASDVTLNFIVTPFTVEEHKNYVPCLDNHTRAYLEETLDEAVGGILNNDFFNYYIAAKNIEIRKDSGQAITLEADENMRGFGEHLADKLIFMLMTEFESNFRIKVRKDAKERWLKKLEKKSKKKSKKVTK